MNEEELPKNEHGECCEKCKKTCKRQFWTEVLRTHVKVGTAVLAAFGLASCISSEELGVRSSPRHITLIVLHVSDTKPSQNFTIEKLAASHKREGFGEYIGYHFYIRRDGTLYYTRPVYLKGCHVAGHNANSIGICSEGGHREDDVVIKMSNGKCHVSKYEDNRTAEQVVVLHELLTVLHELIPDAKLCGHHDLNPAKASRAWIEYAYIFNS